MDIETRIRLIEALTRVLSVEVISEGLREKTEKLLQFIITDLQL